MIYCVHVIQYLRAKDNLLQDYVAFENIVLVEAQNIEEVYEKISKMYEAETTLETTYKWRLAEYVYGGIRQIMEVSDLKKSSLKNGIEISYNKIYLKNKKKLRDVVNGEEVNLYYLQNYCDENMFDENSYNIKESIERLEKKKKLTLDDYFELGEVYFKSKNYEKAIQNFSKAIEIAPDFHIGAYEKRGDCYFNLGDYKKSLDDYKMDLKICKRSSVEIFLKRARIYKIFKEYDNLLDDIQITLEKAYLFKRYIFFEKAGILLKLKRLEEAKELYKYCIEHKARVKMSYFKLLRIYLIENNLDSIKEITKMLNRKMLNKVLLKNGWNIS